MHIKLLVTGAAGFIGYHFIKLMLNQVDIEIIGVDNINDYYDVNLKYGRLEDLGIEAKVIEEDYLTISRKHLNFKFVKMSLENGEGIKSLFQSEKPTHVCNLAAQAGVRYSLQNPMAYVNSNIVGFMNILEACRHNEVTHLVYASSSSVYGLNENIPFSVHHNVDHPISLYAATKKSNELMAHTYSHLYGLPTTGLRFFTVYGPWGRPDMALFMFTKAILARKAIDVFNNGKMRRDFTYIKDIVQGIKHVFINSPKPNTDWDGANPDPGTSPAPYRLYNIGNNNPIGLMDFIAAIEKELGVKAIKNFLPLQPGDVATTMADVTDLTRDMNYKPETTIEEGISHFVKWYKSYYKST